MTYCVEGCMKSTALGLDTPVPLTSFMGLREANVGPPLE